MRPAPMRGQRGEGEPRRHAATAEEPGTISRRHSTIVEIGVAPAKRSSIRRRPAGAAQAGGEGVMLRSLLLRFTGFVALTALTTLLLALAYLA
jgi:hypothetical protein